MMDRSAHFGFAGICSEYLNTRAAKRVFNVEHEHFYKTSDERSFDVQCRPGEMSITKFGYTVE